MAKEKLNNSIPFYFCILYIIEICTSLLLLIKLNSYQMLCDIYVNTLS